MPDPITTEQRLLDLLDDAAWDEAEEQFVRETGRALPWDKTADPDARASEVTWNLWLSSRFDG